jgi:hypothetical protein
MIPQADVTWFIPQILWTTVFVAVQICINQFFVFKRPVAKSKQAALESMLSKIKIIKEDISSLKNHQAEIVTVMQREEALFRSNAVIEQNKIFMQLVKDFKVEISDARNQISSYNVDLKLIDSTKIATKFLQKVGKK